MQSLYQADRNFWTPDDDSDSNEGSVCEDSDSTNSNEKPVSQEALKNKFLIHPTFLTDLVEEEEELTTSSPTVEYHDGPKEIPNPLITPANNRAIRKCWVIHDTFPINKFEEEIPEPALKFPFELDPFQKRAIRHIQKREHTFVTAHTSAGKTVVAEYAIALAAQRNRRAVYTSPVKALSNQKFREFKQKFDSVGIITGDASLNPKAQCIIMTTEILRSMLYRADSIINQLDVVIFDEVHYINDTQRGVVWEEVIIMLPRDVCLVMLSATAPNHKDFADWIGRTKSREVFSVTTVTRPTPLKHYLCFNNKEFLVMENSKFRVAAFNEIYKDKRQTELTKDKTKNSNARGRGKKHADYVPYKSHLKPKKPTSYAAKQKTEVHQLQSLIRKLEQKSQLPVVVFVFSRKRCETLPNAMSWLNFLTSTDEKSRVHTFIKDTFSVLSETDMRLPQIVQVTNLLMRGIGVHHGGLLPIVKECVEILFSYGLVRVLFATETFAMGVNMPARSVVFSSVEKNDGRRLRTLLASEYTQMAGRAGRRGLDAYGTVFILCSGSDLRQDDITRMMVEKATPLESHFRLTFSMMLQLASQNTIKVEDMMTLSFREHPRAQLMPTLKRDLQRVTKEFATIPEVSCIFNQPDAIRKYVIQEAALFQLSKKLHRSLWQQQYRLEKDRKNVDVAAMTQTVSPFGIGRLVGIRVPSISVITLPAVILGQDGLSEFGDPTFRVLAVETCIPSVSLHSHTEQVEKLVNTIVTHETYRGGLEAWQPEARVVKKVDIQNVTFDGVEGPSSHLRCYNIVELPLTSIEIVTNSIVPSEPMTFGACYENKDESQLVLLTKEVKRVVLKNNEEWKPMVLSKRNIHVSGLEMGFLESLLKQKDWIEILNNSICHKCYLKEQHYVLIQHRSECEKIKEYIEYMLRSESLDLYNEMNLKFAFLQELNLVDSNNCITLKGQFAAATVIGDELTLAEVVTEKLLHGKHPSEVAAALSCFVHPEKDQEPSPLGPTPGLLELQQQIEFIHARTEAKMRSINLPVFHEEWWRLCNFGLAMVVYLWAEKTPFTDIICITNVQEGTIVRCIVRLDELIRKIKLAAKVLLDDKELVELMEKTSEAIKHGIVFTKSLYLK